MARKARLVAVAVTILASSSACGDAASTTDDATIDARVLDSQTPTDASTTRDDASLATPDVAAGTHDATTLDARDASAAPPDADTRDANPSDASLGCGATGIHTGDVTRTIVSSGTMRTYLVHVPTGYDARSHVPLVLNHHGYLGTSSQQASITHMTAAADARGWIVVYPQGLDQSWNAGLCCGNSLTRNVPDVQFVRDVLDAMSREYCVDSKRVFATGYSNGGFLSHRLACEMSDRFGAVASVAGVNGAPSCTPARHVPVLQIHGTADPIVPYNGGGLLGLYNYPSVATTMSAWAERDTCPVATTTLLQHGDVTCVTHGACPDNGEVVLCTVQNGGHQWPGGVSQALLGNTSHDLDATSFILDFFERHPLP